MQTNLSHPRNFFQYSQTNTLMLETNNRRKPHILAVFIWNTIKKKNKRKENTKKYYYGKEYNKF